MVEGWLPSEQCVEDEEEKSKTTKTNGRVEDVGRDVISCKGDEKYICAKSISNSESR